MASTNNAFLRINIQGDPDSLHPHTGIDFNCRCVQKALFEGLTRIDQRGKPELAAAESLRVSPSRTVYQFKIRPHSWNNGDPVTAFDFERAWKRGIAPSSSCLRADLFYTIKNAEKAKKGEVSLDEVGIRAVDERTLRIELEHPTPYFLDLISTPLFSPLHDNAEIPSHFNGPFVIKQWEHDESCTLVRNPLYWDAENVQLSGINISMVRDPNTALLMYEKGELDWVGTPFTMLPLDVIAALEKTPILKSQPIAGVYWFCLNTHTFPLNSIKIRKALSYALNRQEIAQHVLKGETPTRSIVPTGMSLLSEHDLFPDGNIALARQLFEEGLRELNITAKEFPPLHVQHSDIPGQKTLVEAIQQRWKEVLGIDVELIGADWNTFFSGLGRRQFQVGGCIWFSVFNDPIYPLEMFKDPSHRYNSPGWENSRYRKLLELADHEIHPEKRNAYLKEAELLLLDEMPIIPLYSVNAKYLMNERVKDVYYSNIGLVDFKWAHIEESHALSR